MIRRKWLFFLFIFVFSFIYISCPREDFSGVYDVELLNYELSKEIVKVNDPVEITVRWCFGDLDADEIVNNKMDKNEAKYPVDKAKGLSLKYTQL